MKPAPKYQAAMVLYHQGDQGIWEHHLFSLMRQHYRDSDLTGLREDLIGLSTVGWVDVLDQREHRGQILRQYRLAESARPLIEYQLNLDTYLPTDLDAVAFSGKDASR
ncbi:hypothetical protein [Mycolicibacterium sp.]|uniref:hypothetical protein n=1 Tax=Mycolicibacterium sp. TaxID=2320850 RepID=UPI00093EBD94|nr:hypothetical protein [Mycobacterium sp. DSM 3803]OKH84588.1 hypothetical protein EB73_00030 [Mycobacterium sp. SWH-M3]